MPKGPLGGPRPFSQYRIVIDPHTKKAELYKVGPFGGPRPLAKNNPPIDDDRVAECIMSDAGQSFGAGVVSMGETTDISDLSPEAAQEAMGITEDWCRGSLEAQAIDDMTEDEAIPALTRIRENLRDQTGQQADVSIEMRGSPEEVESTLVEPDN